MNDDFYHEMYQADDDEASASSAPQSDTNDLRSLGRTVRIVIEGKEVEVPSLAYVRDLEKTIEKMNRALKRLEMMFFKQRETNRRLSMAVDGVANELDGKIDKL